MEGIAPPLKCILELKLMIQNGASVEKSITNYCRGNKDEFSLQLSEWIFLKRRGLSTKFLTDKIKSHFRVSLMNVLWLGHGGVPILKTLQLLEQEVIMACELEIDLYVKKLPFKLLLPLLFLQFPAFLLLLLGPLLLSLINGINL